VRNASVRVPHDAEQPVTVARLEYSEFHKWETFRAVLLVKSVPIIQRLPSTERADIISKMVVREYHTNQHIIRQGEQGDEFFIIREGSVRVVEDLNLEADEEPRTLVTLYEGDFFGEMSLLMVEPRVASVIAAGRPTVCLSLTKAALESTASCEAFRAILQAVATQRQSVRDQRKTDPNFERTRSFSSKKLSNPDMTGASQYWGSRSSKGASEVTVTGTASVKKLAKGQLVVNKYELIKSLGKGSFGDVYLARDVETDREYAMKVLSRSSSSNSITSDLTNNIKREIEVMKELEHENIVSLIEVIDDASAKKIYLVQELMVGGALMSDDETSEPIDEPLARRYFRDILRGLCYLHARGVIHRDIKPQNILLNGDGVAKLADFGASVLMSDDSKIGAGGTPAFSKWPLHSLIDPYKIVVF